MTKLDEAFDSFCQQAVGDIENLKILFYQIKNELETIQYCHVAIDGNAIEKRLNIAFNLHSGFVLSLIKKKDLHDKDLVGINLIKDKHLLISDIVSLKLLKEYISNVQNKLK
jgi:hypothetical protein